MENIRVLYAIYTFMLYLSSAVGIGVQLVAGDYGYMTAGVLTIVSSIVAVYLLILLGKGGAE